MLRRRIACAVAVIATGLLGAAAGAQASVYGIATASGYSGPALFATCATVTVPCPVGALSGYAVAGSGTPESADFAQLAANLGGQGPIGWARFFVPYDALAIAGANGSCVPAPADAPGAVGQTTFDELVWEAQAAVADHLTPEVAFQTGTGLGAPRLPFAGAGTGRAGGDPSGAETLAGQDYRCGVAAIMAALAPGNPHGYPAVTHWEAWNEPNAPSPSGSASYHGALPGACAAATATNPCGQVEGSPSAPLCGAATNARYTATAQCGAIEASELWELADVAARTVSPVEQVAALTTSSAELPAWDDAYAVGIGGSAAGARGFTPGGSAPTVWAVHDYGDVSDWPASGTPRIAAFTRWLAARFGTGQQVWVTEAAVPLRPPCAGVPCPATAADGVPAVQAADAANFLRLASYGNGESITAVDWFELQPANPSTGWDSGLLSPATAAPGAASPDGLGSQRRASFCVLAGISGCSDSSVDASDWSTAFGRAALPAIAPAFWQGLL